jgi:hypothetical protein
MIFRSLVLVVIGSLFFAGCASSKFKQRKEQRDALVKNQGIYCDMVNGDVYPDVEIQTNIEMAKRCDANKSFSVTNYRAPTSDTVGLIYCCALSAAGKDDLEIKPPAKAAKEKEPKEEKKAEKPSETPATN